MALEDGIGIIKPMVAKFRQYIDDKGDSAKWSNAEVMDFLRTAWTDIMSDLMRVSDFKPKARFNISITADTENFLLPPNIGHILKFEEVKNPGTSKQSISIDFQPNHHLSPHGEGWSIEGPVLHLDPPWTEGKTLRLTYIPTFSAPFFEFKADLNDTAANLKTGIVFDFATADDLITPELTPSKEDHAYLGYTIRGPLLAAAATDMEERQIITAYDANVDGVGDNANKALLTVSPGFTDDVAEDDLFEVIPQGMYRFVHLVALKAARIERSIVRDTKGAGSLNGEYRDALRTLRLDHATGQQRTGKRFQRSVRGRGRFGKTR